MSRKYEIVNVGSVKRVRALRSWIVQGRQVNAGDVGGAVFDERTLSQDGDAWIFSGRLDNPLVRVGGDSVVSIGDVVSPRFPHLNIFGTSSIDANFNVSFVTGNLSSARPLTPAMMEQGTYTGTIGAKIVKTPSPNDIRKTAKMFTGGGSFTIPAPEAGYSVRVIAVDENDIITFVGNYTSSATTLGAGAHSYVYLTVAKTPSAAIVPADVTAAALTFQDYAEATINIVDSHVTLSGTGSEGYVMISASGEYQGNVTNIEGSTVQVNRTAGTNTLNLLCDLINTTATVNMKGSGVTVQGVYRNVKNLVWGQLDWSRVKFFRTWIQATDCNNFVMDGINIPVAAANAVSGSALPLVFIRCNMNKASIVNQPLIKNTYVDINFDLATADLDKLTAGNIMSLASSNVNGMYRLQSGSGADVGALVESYESVKDLNIVSSGNIGKSYNTTVYADAYLNGAIKVEGTNVFGNAVKKPKTRTIDVARVAVQGRPNEAIVGRTITGVVADNMQCSIPLPVNLRTAKGLTVKGITGNIQAAFYVTDGKNVIRSIIGWAGDRDLTGLAVKDPQCYVAFSRSNSTAITPADLAGVTIETYNGCKIVNAKTGTMTIAGNVRVEENAVLKDVSVTGSGYFGGNSVTEYPTTIPTPMPIEGAAYMNDNAVFSPTVSAAGAGVSLLDMRDNAVFAGVLNTASTFYNITMANNAEFRGASSTRSGLVMRGNSLVASGCTLVGACKGLLEMEGNARVESGNLTAVGHITLTGDYRQTATKVWTGKRVIDSQDAPQYDNNVKTQYDF